MKKVVSFLSVLIVVTACVFASAVGKRTWEYQFLEISSPNVKTITKLNELDGDGWEVVGIDNGFILLKRKMK